MGVFIQQISQNDINHINIRKGWYHGNDDRSPYPHTQCSKNVIGDKRNTNQPGQYGGGYATTTEDQWS